jgi:cytochrome P450
MTGVTIEQSSLYPVGNLRHMQGDQHRQYRRQIMDAVNTCPLSALRPSATALIGVRLRAFANAYRDNPIPSGKLRRCLHQSASDCMIAIAYGLQPGSDGGDRLARAYDKLGYRAPSNRLGAHQREAFDEIAAQLRDLASHPEGKPRSFLSQLATAGTVDDTLMGNLIYVVETTRFDVASLWRWIMYYLASDPLLIARAKAGDDRYLDAVVYETLRLNQSEYLMRRVSEAFSFDGYAIPKNSRVRICVWEGHKNPETFPDPFSFRPERFLERTFGVDEYAPFGMDKHRCLGADLTVQLSRAFLRAVLDNFAIEPLHVGAPTRGKHHWEPNEPFTVRLLPLPA